MKSSPIEKSKLETGLKGRSFLSTEDLSLEEWQGLFSLAKAAKAQGPLALGNPMLHKSVALVFFNPSLRTRVSMTVAISQLGGLAIPLEIGVGSWDLEHLAGVVMDGAKSEHIKEAVPVLSQYVDAIGVRCFPKQKDFAVDRRDEILEAFRQYATVPVINLESAFWHPCQALADMLTIEECRGGFKKRKVVLTWANHPKTLPHAVPNSFAVAACQMGCDFWLVAPEGYHLDESVLAKCRHYAQEHGGELVLTHDRERAYEGADIIYAKSWASREHYGFPERENRKDLRDWIVTPEWMAKTNKANFMHCLPVRRGVVVADEVLDSDSSIVIPQAANRLSMQKALLASLFAP
jgi:N-acetylornithine carbamoyltransferase